VPSKGNKKYIIQPEPKVADVRWASKEILISEKFIQENNLNNTVIKLVFASQTEFPEVFNQGAKSSLLDKVQLSRQEPQLSTTTVPATVTETLTNKVKEGKTKKNNNENNNIYFWEVFEIIFGLLIIIILVLIIIKLYNRLQLSNNKYDTDSLTFHIICCNMFKSGIQENREIQTAIEQDANTRMATIVELVQPSAPLGKRCVYG